MAAFIFYSCPTCRAHIEIQDAYHSIGEPFVVCEKCSAVFSVAKNRTEWDLKKPMQRKLFVFKVLAISVFLGFGSGGIITEFLAPYLSAVIPMALSVPVGVGFWYWMLSDDMRAAIRASRVRMMDPKYRQSLVRLGIINDADKNQLVP